MPLDFPTSPAVNDTYTFSGKTWKWNGEGWALVTNPDGSIVTAMLANDAVTYAKIQNVSATDKLLGRSTAGAGDIEEITCTAAGRALLDDADAAAQRTTLGAVSTSTEILSGTGLSGGGNLSTSRTLTADIATQAEAEAGTSSTKLMTPQRTAQAIATNVRPASFTAEALIVAGGGSGGATSGTTATGRYAGGGGAGELRVFSDLILYSGITYTVTVGAGASGATSGAGNGSSGSQSSVTNLSSKGGGGGGSAGTSTGSGTARPGLDGGSGGGAAAVSTTYNTTPGVGVASSPWSYDFITIDTNSARGGAAGSASGGGGGGGANAAGSTTTGGAGLSSSITGSAVTYAAGGNGGINGQNAAGSDGTANLGNGGGGAAQADSTVRNGGNGGSGVVIIAYPDSYPAPKSITGTYNEPSRSGWRVYRFTGSGSFTL